MLINTKLKIPSLKSSLLFRKDLIEQLRSAEGYPFILISGPAGSGKTSLVCQWVREKRIKVAWYSLDQEDNEADLFFRYLLAAFIRADDWFDEVLGPMLRNRQRLTGEVVIPLIIESFSCLDRRIHLVLDDFHYIENEEILAAIARLIQYVPTLLRIVILSRFCLPASLEAVVLKKERLEITDADLRFTVAETADLFRKLMPGYRFNHRIRDLNRLMEGWAAGLQLVGLSIRSKGPDFSLPTILNQAHEKVASYLIYDILSRQPEKIRNFVLTTALLDRFNPDLCNQLTHSDDSARILARLTRMNLFLIPLNGHNNWYRYHHIFSEVVRHRVSLDDPPQVPATLRNAASWFAANNHLEDAMRSAVGSGDLEFAADLMEDHLSQYLELFDPMAGLRWILKLPIHILNQRPLLRLHQCNFLMVLMELSQLKEILLAIERRKKEALDIYSGEKRALCEDYIIYLRCMLKVLDIGQSRDLHQSKPVDSKVLKRNRRFSISLDISTIFNLISRGDFPSAEKSLAVVSERLAATDVILKRIFFGKAKALMARYCGRLNEAEAIINQILQDIKREGWGNGPAGFILHKHLGHIYFLQNKLDMAQECADMAMRYCGYTGLVSELTAGSELQFLLHLAADRKEQAAESIQVMRTYSIKLGMRRIADSIDACVARMAIEQGNLASAVLWSQRRKLHLDESFSLLFVVEGITLARLYIAQKKYPKAASLLETLRSRCLKRELFEFVLQIDILRSAAFHALNHLKSAESLMMEALVFSEKEGYVRSFASDAGFIAPILRSIADELSGTSLSPHLKEVFAVCNIPLSPSALSNGNEHNENEDLTQREIEILEWMAQGRQNKEIAQEASISINTVKTHVRSILAKLGVKTRTQAIIKAGEIDLV